MDSAEKIAIAEITSILSKNELINPYKQAEVWLDILRRAGLSGKAKAYESSLTPYIYNGSYKNENPKFNKIYSALYSIFINLYESEDPFSDENEPGVKSIQTLLREIVAEINPLNTVSCSLTGVEEHFMGSLELLEERIEKKKRGLLARIVNDSSKWEEYGTDLFKRFIRALRILSLDLKLDQSLLVLRPLTSGVVEREEDISALEAWLARSHPEVLKAYSDAIDNYQDGRYGSCISDCRVALTGLFSNYAETENWFNGLLKLTPDTYQDAEKVLKLKNASKIMQDKIEGEFPRFKVIYRIYSLYCELGSHRTEGVEEDPSVNDALWSLRLLEDVMVWAMNVLPTTRE